MRELLDLDVGRVVAEASFCHYRSFSEFLSALLRPHSAAEENLVAAEENLLL